MLFASMPLLQLEGAAPVVAKHASHRDKPPGHAGKHQIDPDSAPGEIVGAAVQITLPAADHKTLDVLTDNEVIQETRCLQLCQDIPGR